MRRSWIDGRRRWSRIGENRPAVCGGFIGGGGGEESRMGSRVESLGESRVTRGAAAGNVGFGILKGEKLEGFAEVERSECAHVGSLHQAEEITLIRIIEFGD